MSNFLQFIQSEQFLGLSIAFFIFIVTIFLVAKRYIDFSIALLLLLFALVSGILINHHTAISDYFYGRTIPDARLKNQSQDQNDFQQHMKQAIESLQREVTSEKENLQKLMNQVSDIVDVVDAEKYKLQQFIEETRERLTQHSLVPSTQSHPKSPEDEINPLL